MKGLHVAMSFASLAPEKTTTDLSWVEFSEEEAQPCMSMIGCDKEATWKATYEWSCPCWSTVWYYCEEDGQILYDLYFGKDAGIIDFRNICKKCEAPGGLKSLVRWKKGNGH